MPLVSLTNSVLYLFCGVVSSVEIRTAAGLILFDRPLSYMLEVLVQLIIHLTKGLQSRIGSHFDVCRIIIIRNL